MKQDRSLSHIQPPQDGEAEQAVIGSILKDQDALDSVVGILPDESYFYSPRHRTIYLAILELHRRQDPVDYVTVASQLLNTQKLETVGGRSYLVELAESVGSTINVVKYAETVKEKSILRRIIDVNNEVSRSATNGEQTSVEIINHLQSYLYALSQNENISKPVSLAERVISAADGALSPQNQGNDIWLETRIADLNTKITGLFYGDYVIVAGDPSMGKTMFALDFVMYNANYGKKSFIVSLDQSTQSLAFRFLTGATGYSKNRILSGQLSEDEKNQIGDASAHLSVALSNVYVNDNGGQTVIDIRTQARQLKRTVGLDILMVDYVQLIAPHRRGENRNLELTEQSRILNEIAKELNIVLVVLSQLNRTNAERYKFDPVKNYWRFPNKHMLRDSGSLAQDANVILFPYIPYEACKQAYGDQSDTFGKCEIEYEAKNGTPLKNMGYVVVDKNKDGETGVVVCRRDPVRMRFFSQAREHR